MEKVSLAPEGDAGDGEALAGMLDRPNSLAYRPIPESCDAGVPLPPSALVGFDRVVRCSVARPREAPPRADAALILKCEVSDLADAAGAVARDADLASELE